MASSIGNSMNMRLFDAFFGSRSKRKFGFSGTFTFSAKSWSLDSFSSTTSSQLIQQTVAKMQAILNRTPATGGGASSQTAFSSPSLNANSQLTPQIPPPTQADIDQAVADVGGHGALTPWLVDGKTKLDINGRRVVADVVAPNSGNDGDAVFSSSEKADPREAALRSIARFGLGEDALKGDGQRLRERLKDAAATAAAASPKLASAIEYALEDAFAKVSAWETSVNGGGETVDYEKQRDINRGQAQSIASQLGIEGQSWGIDSLGEDLAVFGMDFASLQGDPFDLAETVRVKSREMLADLEKRYVGTEAEFIAQRNRITGASARLVNGLEGASGLAVASMGMTGVQASAKVGVSVGGTSIDANFVIGVGNVIVDPLVLDLNGDGIDLKGADEGVAFDMTGDGNATEMGFIRGDDALLFLDLYGDGMVRDGRQLFGNADGHANGFDMLASYDENGDGVIDENDAIYDQLMVWQEKNENGVCDEGETMTLREAGVKSIDLGYRNVREDDGKGNLIGQTGSFTRDDGTTGLAADAWFQEKRG